jgi:hypothetical protein
MSETLRSLRHRSTYLVIAQDFFFPAIFFQLRSPLRPQFHFLTDSQCLADVVAAGNTDINLGDGRFWKQFGIKEPTIYEKHLRWHKARTEEDLSAWGHTIESLLNKVHPDRRSLPPAMVPHLGQLILRRNALPNVRRSRTFLSVANFFAQSSWPLFLPDDQSLAHMPLTVVDRRFSISLSQSGAHSNDRVKVNDKTLNVRPKLRIHVYPYGLCTAYILLSCTSAQVYSTNELISLLRAVLPDAKQDLANHLSILRKRTLYSVPSFMNWLSECLTNAFHVSPATAVAVRGNIRFVACVNTDNPEAEASEESNRELLGIATANPHWYDLSASFLRQYLSLFGKYAGEYVTSAGENLVLYFGPWQRPLKRKTRPRFNWGLISVYRLALAQKFVALTLRRAVTAGAIRTDENASIAQSRIESWLEVAEIQHGHLTSWHRRFFYRVGEAIGLSSALEELKAPLERRRAHSETEHLKRITDSISGTIHAISDDVTATLLNAKQGMTSMSQRLERLEEVQIEVDERLGAMHEMIQGLVYLTQPQEQALSSILEALLGENLWFHCSADSRWCLLTAEHLYLTLREGMDFSAAMIEYCKAIEIELNERIVEPAIRYVRSKVPKRYISVGSRRLGPEGVKHLTLGSFPFLFSSKWTSRATNREYSNLSYDRDIEPFMASEFDLTYDQQREGSEVASIVQTIADYRNRSAHREIVPKDLVTIIRNMWEEEVGDVHRLLSAFLNSGIFTFNDDEEEGQPLHLDGT